MKKMVLVLAVILSAMVAVLGGCAASSPGANSVTSTGTAASGINGTPNFRLLVSDEVNDIADFAWLNVTITKLGLQQGSDSSPWIEYDINPTATVDLVQLQGLNATAVWTAALPVGTYNKAFIYVDNVVGALKVVPPSTTTTPVTVKLPSGKLQIAKTFDIVADNVTNFVYDITVHRAGQSGKYILKPQVSQSGAGQAFDEVDREGKPVQSGRQGQGKPDQQGNSEQQGSLSLAILPLNPVPNAPATLTVTFQGAAVVGAEVKVNGLSLPASTGQDGKVTFTVPLDAQELSIWAKKGQREGTLVVAVVQTP